MLYLPLTRYLISWLGSNGDVTVCSVGVRSCDLRVVLYLRAGTNAVSHPAAGDREHVYSPLFC